MWINPVFVIKYFQMEKVLSYLGDHNIGYTLHEHIAVFTCEEAKAHAGDIPGMACKNLLLRNRKKTRFILLVLPANKKTDIKAFSLSIGEKNLSFTSSDLLMEKLGLEPGSVSPFGLINDVDNTVDLYIHREVYDASIVTFHPNINTATLELTREMFHRYLGGLVQEVEVMA